MCTVEAYRYICVFSAKRGKRLSQASLFPPFLSLIHILPICFDSAQVLYIYISVYIILFQLPRLEGCNGRERMVVGLPMQSVPIITNVLSSNPAQARCTQYNIM